MTKEEFLDIIKDVGKRKKEARDECARICKDLDATLKENEQEYIKDNAKFKVGDIIKYKYDRHSTCLDTVAALNVTNKGNIRCRIAYASLNQDNVERASDDILKPLAPLVEKEARFKVGDVIMYRKRAFKISKICFRTTTTAQIRVLYMTEQGKIVPDNLDVTKIETVTV